MKIHPLKSALSKQSESIEDKLIDIVLRECDLKLSMELLVCKKTNHLLTREAAL